jgi:hypothetical protein
MFKVDCDLDRALILGEIACCHSRVLKIALTSACAIFDETKRIFALKAIVNNLPSGLLSEFIDQFSIIVQDSILRKEILLHLTQRKHLVKNNREISEQPLSEELKNMEALSEPINKADYLHKLLPRLPLGMLPLKRWVEILHLLAHRKRADLMGDLATLYPAIIHLGGEAAMRGVVDEMKRVCEQWP